MTMTSISDRIRKFLQANIDRGSFTQATLAQHLGIGRSAVSRMLSGERQVSAVELMGIKDFFGLSFAELGRELAFDEEDNLDLYIQAVSEQAPSKDKDTLQIRSFDDGHHSISLSQEMFGSVKMASPGSLRWLRIFDDAMSPSVERGDTVVVDERMKGATGLYVLDVSAGHRSVRRLDGSRWGDGELLVHVGADNAKFRSYEAPLSSLKVVGLVLLRITDRV